MENSEKFLDLFSANKIAIFLQKKADADCVCAAFALRAIIGKEKVDIYGEIFKNRFPYIKDIGVVKETIVTGRKYEHCFFVDTPTLKNVYESKEALGIARKSKVWIIDHHSFPEGETIEKNFLPLTNFYVTLWKPELSSACEVIWDLLTTFSQDKGISNKIKKNINISREVLITLLSGILWETRIFRTSNYNTFKHIFQMLKSNPSITWSDINTDSSKSMLRFEKFWAHSLLNNTEILEPSNIVLINVKWEEFKKFFFWFGLKDGEERYKKEKRYTYLLDKALNLRLDCGGGNVNGAIVIYPCTFDPFNENDIMYEGEACRSDEQHQELLKLGFLCQKSNKKRYTLFETSKKGGVDFLIKEIARIEENGRK